MESDWIVKHHENGTPYIDGEDIVQTNTNKKVLESQDKKPVS